MNAYEVIARVGEGAYGLVLKCRHKESSAIVAIKKFKETEDEEAVRRTTLREVKILRLLRSQPNIVQLHEAFRRRGKLYLVFEYFDCNLLELLSDHANGLPLDLVRRYIYQMVRSIHSCHSNSVIHRDVKPENILVDPVTHRIALCDFGFARVCGGTPLTDYVATRWYRPPELLLGMTSYDASVDMWAVGCILAELLDGQPLFPGESDAEQLCMLVSTLGRLTPAHEAAFRACRRFQGVTLPTLKPVGVERRYLGRLTLHSAGFLKATLKINPAERISSEAALAHPWFAGIEEELGYAPVTRAPVPAPAAPPSIRKPSIVSTNQGSTPAKGGQELPALGGAGARYPVDENIQYTLAGMTPPAISDVTTNATSSSRPSVRTPAHATPTPLKLSSRTPPSQVPHTHGTVRPSRVMPSPALPAGLPSLVSGTTDMTAPPMLQPEAAFDGQGFVPAIQQWSPPRLSAGPSTGSRLHLNRIPSRGDPAADNYGSKPAIPPNRTVVAPSNLTNGLGTGGYPDAVLSRVDPTRFLSGTASRSNGSYGLPDHKPFDEWSRPLGGQSVR